MCIFCTGAEPLIIGAEPLPKSWGSWIPTPTAPLPVPSNKRNRKLTSNWIKRKRTFDCIHAYLLRDSVFVFCCCCRATSVCMRCLMIQLFHFLPESCRVFHQVDRLNVLSESMSSKRLTCSRRILVARYLLYSYNNIISIMKVTYRVHYCAVCRFLYFRLRIVFTILLLKQSLNLKYRPTCEYTCEFSGWSVHWNQIGRDEGGHLWWICAEHVGSSVWKVSYWGQFYAAAFSVPIKVMTVQKWWLPA